jgi:dihydroorotase
MRFDLLIKGGEIVDPSTGYFGPGDVAVQRDRVAAVAHNIPTESAFRVIDASSLLVTPGLIDLHAHVWHGILPPEGKVSRPASFSALAIS